MTYKDPNKICNAYECFKPCTKQLGIMIYCDEHYEDRKLRWCQVGGSPDTTRVSELEAEVAIFKDHVVKLWPAIKHGDEDHQAWLKKQIDHHFEDCFDGTGGIALLNKLDEMQAECDVARERLGPAGWKLLSELLAAREVVKMARGENEAKLDEAIAAYDKVCKGES